MARDAGRTRLPHSPTRALREFLATEAAGGVLLLVATAAALVWANSPFSDSYERLWETVLSLRLGDHGISMDLHHWVNDGLMALFFLVVGLEVKRELLLGELRDPRRAALPVAGAIGGMVVPALIFLLLNVGSDGANGWGVPMATDIAFAIGVLAVVAPGVPGTVRLFLLTLAIVDDIGAIIVIALFYSSGVDGRWLGAAAAILVLVVLLRRAGVTTVPVFVLLGLALWFAVHEAGIHATLAGVAMGLLVPATPALDREIVRSKAGELLDVFTPEGARETSRIARQSVSELEWLEHQLHGWSSFVIIPVFALANAGVVLSAASVADAATSTVTLGVIAGLVVGKPLGITGAAWLATRLRLAELPDDATWPQVAGVATLAGIGFTVSLFIAGLAFDTGALVTDAKVGILAASLLASVAGAIMLRHGHRQGIPADPVHRTAGGD